MRRGSRAARRTFRPQAESLEPRCLFAALIHDSDLAYLGAFRLPGGTLGDSSFDFGGTALAYNPVNDSLFMVGHDWQQAVAEVNIPALTTGSIGALNTASVRQNFVNVLQGLDLGLDPGETIKVGGLLVDDNQLLGSAYVFYDAEANQDTSHFTISSLDLASATRSGLYQVGTRGGGWVGGWMTHVPSEWQGALRTSYLTGNGALAIISRTSWGPSAFGFDPNQVGPTTAPANSLLYYTQNEPLAAFDEQNEWFNGSTEIRGIAFPDGSDSILFTGSHGTGPLCYGDGDPCGDPVRSEKGYHAYPYRYQVWAYDAHVLAAVNNGQLQPWEVQPYDVWELELPYSGGGVHIGGVAYDAANNRIYVSQSSVDEWGLPIVHAFQVRPVADFVDVSPDPRNSAVDQVAVKFSNDITGLDAGDFELTRNGIPVSLDGLSLSNSGSSYSLDLTDFTGSDGIYLLTLRAAESGISDLFGADFATDATDMWVTDTEAPTADIVDVTPDQRNSAVGFVTITFSESVTGVDRGDFALTRNGTAVNIGSVPFAGNGSSYTLDLTDVTGAEGAYVLTLTTSGAGIQDLAGNTLSGESTDTWTTDTTAPTADIVGISPDPRNIAVSPVPITFSEEVTGLDRSDFTLTRNGAVVELTNATVTGSGASYTLNLTNVTADEGTYVLTLTAAGSGISDLVGNPLGTDATDTWLMDTTAPAADIVNISPDPRKSAVGSVTITFSEEVTGVDRGDFALTRNGTAVDLTNATFSGNGASYTLNLTSVTADEGTYVLTLTASGSGIADLVGNGLSADATDSWVTDTTAPSADIVDVTPDPRNSAVGIVTINFSELVTGVDWTDFSLTHNGAPVSLANVPFTGSGSTYTLDLAGVTADEGNYVLTLTASGSGITDGVGNPLGADATDSWLTDTTAPMADIVDVSPDPRNATVGSVTITFSEDVAGVDRSDFILTLNGAPVNITNVPFAGSGTNYTLDLTDVTGTEGTYILTLTAAGSGISDLAGNAVVDDAQDSWIVRLYEWHNYDMPLDVSDEDRVSVFDAALIINELNGRVYSSPRSGTLPPLDGSAPPHFFDVSKDGRVSVFDAVLIINFLNLLASLPSAEGEFGASTIPTVSVVERSPTQKAAARALVRGESSESGSLSRRPSGGQPKQADAAHVRQRQRIAAGIAPQRANSGPDVSTYRVDAKSVNDDLLDLLARDVMQSRSRRSPRIR